VLVVPKMWVDVKLRIPALCISNTTARNGFTELSIDRSQDHTVSSGVGRVRHRIPSYLIDDDLDVLSHISPVEIVVLTFD